MNTSNIEQAKINMKRLERLRTEEKELKASVSYLPEKYDEVLVNQAMNSIESKIEQLEYIKAKIETLNKSGDSLDENETYEKLDDIIASIEKLLIQKENFGKYKKLNDSMETIFTEAVLSLSDSRGDLFSSIFEDKLANNTSISSFINLECLRNKNIKKPFMVALLTMDFEMIYDEITNGTYSLTDEQKRKIYDYILFQKNRISRNLVLSDKSLINLLESNTGRNIIEQERINSKNKYYDYCNQFSYELFNKSIDEQLLISSAEYVFNAFDLSPLFKMLSNTDKYRIKEQLIYLKNNSIYDQMRADDTKRYNQLQYQNALLSKDGSKYNILTRRSNAFHSLTGERIKRFSNNRSVEQFNRTIEDMKVANFPIADVENYLFECFSSNKVSNEVKQQLIATVLDNLQLCYDMFRSYYRSGNMDLTSYLHMTSGDTIELNYQLDEKNLPHILGIPKTHELDANKNIVGLNLPIETLKILELNINQFSPALDVLERILEKKDEIIEALGCYVGTDGALYEMLPWEKIILKTNAFIRGDFFKNTSLITGINSDSYLIDKHDKINAVAINSTYFNGSAVNQNVPNIRDVSPLLNGGTFINGRNSLLQKNKDLILKGLIAQFEQDKIKRIEGVKTNESFIGERYMKSNGIPLKTMNKPAYLLENINHNSSGVVMSVENTLGYKEYSIDEQILLLEDLALQFENSQSVMNMVYTTIEQIEQLSNSKRL